jgi:hypothetical protein
MAKIYEKGNTWEEFKKTGLLRVVNASLSIFGWMIVYEMDGEKIVSVLPHRRVMKKSKDNTEVMRQIKNTIEAQIATDQRAVK